ELPLRVAVDGAHPAGELAHRRAGGVGADGARVGRPGLLPVGDVARPEAVEPEAEAEADQALGPLVVNGRRRGSPERAVAARDGAKAFHLSPPRLSERRRRSRSARRAGGRACGGICTASPIWG